MTTVKRQTSHPEEQEGRSRKLWAAWPHLTPGEGYGPAPPKCHF